MTTRLSYRCAMFDRRHKTILTKSVSNGFTAIVLKKFETFRKRYNEVQMFNNKLIRERNIVVQMFL